MITMARVICVLSVRTVDFTLSDGKIGKSGTDVLKQVLDRSNETDNCCI